MRANLQRELRDPNIMNSFVELVLLSLNIVILLGIIVLKGYPAVALVNDHVGNG